MGSTRSLCYMAFLYWLDSKLLTKFMPISTILYKYLLLLTLYVFYPLLIFSYFTKISIIFKNILKDNNAFASRTFINHRGLRVRIIYHLKF